MSFEIVVGANWGDEGKGRVVDYLARDADYVVRFQGGNNAGHTVVNQYGEFALHLLPSGVFNPKTVNVLGPGMVIDLAALVEELESLAAQGIVPDLRISDRATICFPFHPMEERWEEERLGERAFGSTGRGISPAYGDRTVKRAIQIGELCYPERFRKRLGALVEWKLALAEAAYGQHEPFNLEEMLAWSYRYFERLRSALCDSGQLLGSALADGKGVLFEAQLGSLRDRDLGIYPFTTSSSVLAAYAPIGGGVPGYRPDRVTAVVKAFSTCVGAGPFVTRMSPDAASALRESAGEYGATTGRPREIGHFDGVATRYGVALQGADRVALTKLDCLSGMDTLRVCTGYRYGGDVLNNFPVNAVLEEVKPEYREVPGWEEPLGEIRRFEELPREARDYVELLETMIKCPITLISVGREREQMIVRSEEGVR